MEAIIRDFTIDDITSLARLPHQLGYPTTAAEMKARMEMISKNPDYKTAVAVSDQSIVGYVGINRQLFWEQNGCFVRIQALVVDASVRGYGIGIKSSVLQQMQLTTSAAPRPSWPNITVSLWKTVRTRPLFTLKNSVPPLCS